MTTPLRNPNFIVGGDRFSATITGSGTANTKGDWSDLVAGASVTRDLSGLLLGDMVIGATGATNACLMDIGLGNTGNAVDRIAVTNVPIGGWSIQSYAWLPIYIPAGTRIAARLQSTTINKVATPEVTILHRGPPPQFRGFSFGETLSVDLTTSAFTYGDLTDNAYEQIIASTARAYQGLSVFANNFDASSAATAPFALDLGIGGAGAEMLLSQTDVEILNTEIIHQRDWTLIGKYIPVGSRLALRKNTGNDMTGGVIGWVA